MKSKKTMTTFSKMTLTFIGLGLVPLLLLSLFFVYRFDVGVRDSQIKNTQDRIGYFAVNVGDVFDNVDESMGLIYDYETSDGNTIAEILSDDSTTESVLEKEMNSALKEMLHASSYLSGVRFVDEDGVVYSQYYSQKKHLNENVIEKISIAPFIEEDNPNGLYILGTFPESEICTGSEDYVFSMVRQYMDTRSIQSTSSSAIGTMYFDVDVRAINDLAVSLNLNEGDYYVINKENGSYIYSEDENNYLDGSNPLEFCIEKIDSDEGYVKVNSQWVFFSRVDDTDAFVVYVIENGEFMGNFAQIRSFLLLILSFCCAVLLLLSFGMSVKMSTPTRQLKEAMKQVEQGNLAARVDINTNDEMKYIGDGFNQMIEQLSNYIDEMYVARLCQKDAELNALKMQIKPHFLYNTLEVIRMTAIDQDDEKTARLLESLAGQMQYVLGDVTDESTLEEELDSLRRYFVLMQARYEDKIALNINVADSDLRLLIPKFLLQPIVENSIKHGLKEKNGAGQIVVHVDRKDDYLEIVIMDDGVGMSEEKTKQLNAKLKSSKYTIDAVEEEVSVGVRNVYERIKLTCGPEYGFEITSVEGMGTAVTYKLPIWE